MITIRRSNERGKSVHSWLQSRHTFSFAGYHDPEHMGVSALRVINDDLVIAGKGFATHSHKDMEIISYVKKGTIEHKDSMGNIKKLPAGEFQLMSAGTGITHSEYNPSMVDALAFLQIWIKPDTLGIEPGYQQKLFNIKQGMQLIVSPDGRDGSLRIHQDACLYQLIINVNETVTHTIKTGRTIYVQVVSGVISIDGKQLKEGDGAVVKEKEFVNFSSAESVEALVFDLP